MTTDQKIQRFKKSIEVKYVTDFNLKLDEVLSFCESPIERLMFLQLVDYFMNYNGEVDQMNSFKFEFIEDRIYLEQTYPNELDRARIKRDVINKFNYRTTPQGYAKYIGFKAVSIFQGRDNEKEKLCRHEYVIYPQKEVAVTGGQYRIDIAVILNRIFIDGEVDSRKIALECDGYDYHKDPEKFKLDKIRERELKQHGWKEVLRYAGSEIYTIDNDMLETHYNVKQMTDILLL